MVVVKHHPGDQVAAQNNTQGRARIKGPWLHFKLYGDPIGDDPVYPGNGCRLAVIDALRQAK